MASKVDTGPYSDPPTDCGELGGCVQRIDPETWSSDDAVRQPAVVVCHFPPPLPEVSLPDVPVVQ